MSRMDDLRQSATPLDRFLRASVGEDRNGNPVTVLSTFARLGLDPWEEASGLSRLTRETASLRLGGLLARFQDVAASADGSGPTVQRLIDLLPQHSASSIRGDGDPAPSVKSPGLGPLLAILALLLVLAQSFFGGSEGPGD